MYNQVTFFENLPKITEALSAQMDKAHVQRTYSRDHTDPNGKVISGTYKEFDTTGFPLQYCINRLNDVLGVCGWRVDKCQFTDLEPVTLRNGRTHFQIECEITISIGYLENGHYIPVISRTGFGGHTGKVYYEVKKGAKTNAFKKCLSEYGIGREAYEHSIDDDDKSYYADITTIANYEAGVETTVGKKLVKNNKPKCCAKDGADGTGCAGCSEEARAATPAVAKTATVAEPENAESAKDVTLKPKTLEIVKLLEEAQNTEQLRIIASNINALSSKDIDKAHLRKIFTLNKNRVEIEDQVRTQDRPEIDGSYAILIEMLADKGDVFKELAKHEIKMGYKLNLETPAEKLRAAIEAID